jgi:eukaryotic-like serine/threonine-protein kinase
VPPTVAELRRDAPPRVSAAVARALAKDPRDRFASMEAFAAELDACLHELRTAGDTDSTATVITAPAPRAKGRPSGWRASPTPVIVAVLALAALAVIAVAAFAVNRDNSNNPTTTSTSGGGSGAAVSLTGVGGYDPPPGDGTEHDSDAPNATDDDPATYWTTEHYGSQDFGGIKKGVGVVLDAPRSVALKKLTVTSDTPGFTALVRAGDSPESARADSSSQTMSGTTTFTLNGRAGSVYVLWITQLAPGGAAHVNGVTATS